VLCGQYVLWGQTGSHNGLLSVSLKLRTLLAASPIPKRYTSSSLYVGRAYNITGGKNGAKSIT